MDKLLNICCFARVNYWHGIHGGMDLHSKLLSEGFISRGHRVTMISTKHSQRPDYEKRNGVSIYFLKNTVLGSHRNGWAKESLATFWKLHRQIPFDVIWSQSFDGFPLAKAQKDDLEIKVIATLHGCIQQEIKTFFARAIFRWKNPQRLMRAFLGLFYSYIFVQKPLLNTAEKLVTVSNKVAHDIEKWFGLEIAAKCMTVPNGIDIQNFRPDSSERKILRSLYKVTEDEILLLTLGRLTHEKGHHLAVEVLRKLKIENRKVKLIVVGDGDNRRTIMELVQKYDLQRYVHSAGLIENSKTSQYYNGADIFLMPTVTVEGLPFVLLEAMACAKPVIASDIGGNNSVVDDGKNGILVCPGDINQLTNKTRWLIENPEASKKIAEAARNTIVKNFGVDDMIDKTIQIFRGNR